VVVLRKHFGEEDAMTRFRKTSLILAGSIVLIWSWAAAQTEEANNILGQAGSGVVTIIGYGSDKAEILKGTAFALSEDVVVTAYHAISQAFDVEGLNIKGKKVKIDGILGIDKAHNVAILKLKSKIKALPIGSIDRLEAGARLFAIGSNESGQLIISEGTFRRTVDAGNAGELLEISLSVPEQFRGGPLLDINGQLVGMLLVLERSLKFGLPVGTVVGVPRADKVVAFKSQTQENFFETVEGNAFAARAAVALDDLLTARIHLERAVKIDPSDLGGQILLADIYSRQRDYAGAVTAYRKAAQLDPNRADAYYGLGSTLLKQTQYKDAAEALEKAASLGYPEREIYFELGSAYEAVQDFAKAAAAYERYISFGPAEAWSAYQRLGICRTNLGEFDLAVAALLEAQKAQPKDIKVRDTLADAYIKAGRLESAEEVYLGMAEINPAEAKVYNRQAYQMYVAADRNDRAVAPLKRIIELDPKNETNFYYLGLTYFKLQQYDKAVAAFQQSLAVKPDFAHAWYQIGSSYFNAKKYREAAGAYKKYVELAPTDATGWLNIGVAYNQAKDYESALEPLRKCVELKPDDSIALANLTIVYINLKDNYSAKEIYNRLLTLDPAQAERLKKYIR
jgi:tetratricopeptide (TPR) repeat protein